MSVTNLIGLTFHGNSSSLPEITSRIVCIWPAGFVFKDITELYILALAFISCGHKYNAAVHITSVNQVTISNCLFQNNTNFIDVGGALYIQESTLNATENIFQDNSAAEGGALYFKTTNFNTAVHTIVGNTFQRNHAINGGSLNGIVMYCSMFTFKNNTFQKNWADTEGGTVMFHLTNSNLIFTSNVFRSNYALRKGVIMIVTFGEGTITLKGNIFQNNSAHRGGVLYADSGNYTLISNTFHSNLAADQGGALYFLVSSIVLINNSFTKIARNLVVQFLHQTFLILCICAI